MLETVKDVVRSPFVKKRDDMYYAKLNRSYVSYHDWILKREKQYLEKHLCQQENTGNVTILSYEDCGSENFPADFSMEGITVFARHRENLAKEAASVFAEYFSRKEDCVLCYSDEDEWNSSRSIRMNPSLKPEFSPDLLLSYFYFGNVFAVRNSVLGKIKWLGSGSPDRNLYDMCLQICFSSVSDMRTAIGHLNYVTLHSPAVRYFGRGKDCEDIKRPYRGKMQNRKKEVYSFNGTELVKDEDANLREQLTSIVILSKDHPEVLDNCLSSVTRFSKKDRYEIIVVDNGSSDENREKYEKLKIKYKFNYIYIPQKFNFSRMCNQGAAAAKGEYLLFVNDDTEVRQSSWLLRMKQHAVKPYAGAVGAKLYYPESKVIQHAGITNILLGPVHKQQFLDDTDCGIYALSNVDRDVIAVTGACLMIKRNLFMQSGGFSEKLDVAFNDVELCFRLYEKGYYNIICNSIHLWHYESFSRGDDESEENQKRLQRERTQLYRLHPGLYGKDPFYHPYMNQLILDVHPSFAYEYPYAPGSMKGEIEKLSKKPDPSWENDCLLVSLEYADSLEEFVHLKKAGKKSSDSRIFVQGYAFVLEADNSCYDFSVLFEKEDGEVYSGRFKPCYRPDLNRNLSQDYHADMNGFSFTFDKNDLPKGRYRVGVFAKCAVSRQRLYRMTGKILKID